MADKPQSLQDYFLNGVRRSKSPVTLFLLKGVKLQGVITWFDAFSLLLRRDGVSQLVYTHAISTIMPQVAPPLDQAGGEGGKGRRAALQAHDWPGNVRQLRNIIERTLILTPGDRVDCIEVDLLPAEVMDTQGTVSVPSASMSIMGSPLREARESFEREYLKIQIRRFSGNISRTASFIGMERSALHRKLKALGLGDKRDSEE